MFAVRPAAADENGELKARSGGTSGLRHPAVGGLGLYYEVLHPPTVQGTWPDDAGGQVAADQQVMPGAGD